MTHDLFRDARGHPEEEEAKPKRRRRQKKEEKNFRAAKKNERFAKKDSRFTDAEGEVLKKGKKKQQQANKRKQADKVRKGLKPEPRKTSKPEPQKEELFGNKEGSFSVKEETAEETINTGKKRDAFKKKASNRMNPDAAARQVKENFTAGETIGEKAESFKASKAGKKQAAKKFGRSLREGSIEEARSLTGKSVLSDQESDPVAAKTARGSYGAARLSAQKTVKGVSDIRRHFNAKSVRAGKDLFLSESEIAKSDLTFSGDAVAVNLRRNAFYGMDEGRIRRESVRQKAAREAQKKLIRKNYQQAQEKGIYIPILSRIRNRFRDKSGGATITVGKTVASKVAEFFETHPMVLIFALVIAVAFLVTDTVVSGGATLLSHTVSPASLATTYTAEDVDILAAERDYRAMEADLASKVNDLTDEYPGYTSYGLTAGQIGHNPYKLAALLTVLHEDYRSEDVQETLQQIFNLQYSLAARDEAGIVEKKTVRVGQSLGTVVTSGYCACSICCGQWAGGPTASGVMPTANHTIAVDAYTPFVPMGTKVVMNGIEYTVEDTGAFARYGVAFDVYYDDHAAASQHGHQNWEAFLADENGDLEVKVLVSRGSESLSASLANNGIDAVAGALLSDDEKERYDLLVECKGNKPELFANDIYAGGGAGFFDYTIAGDALSDQVFANMMAEATKYLGYPYVWGGSTPASSFDCSGFVCWVINNSGNGWNAGRTTADALCNMLPKVDPSEARPGDIIFFQGTYATPGASHVGIYVGDGMMIHCGDPIQYASVNTAYWQQHFYCYGRLPE